MRLAAADAAYCFYSMPAAAGDCMVLALLFRLHGHSAPQLAMLLSCCILLLWNAIRWNE